MRLPRRLEYETPRNDSLLYERSRASKKIK